MQVLFPAAKETVCCVVEEKCAEADGNPQQAVHQADLAPQIQRGGTVIPDIVAAIAQQSSQQLHRCDDHAAGYAPQGQGKGRLCPVQTP